MRTRKKTRKAINVPGRYFNGTDSPVDVVLRDISEGGCRFPIGAAALAIGAPVQVYIAGTGPYRGAVRWIQNGEVGINFIMPIDPDRFDQFKSSHIPDPSMPQDTAFEPMPNHAAAPRRFC